VDDLKTLHDLFPRMAAFGDRPAVVAFTKRDQQLWSYALLVDQAQSLAAGLVQEGLAKDDPVAIFAEDSPEWFVACLAVIAAGGVVVPLDVQLSDDALQHALRDSGVHTVFTSRRQYERLRRVAGAFHLETILLGESCFGLRTWQEMGAAGATEPVQVGPEDRAVLFYTSGTTGPPKGVPLTHANLVYQLNTVAAAELVTQSDRLLLPLPLHHVYPFVIGMLTPFAIGLPIILPYNLTGPQLMRTLREGEVTAIIGVPRLYRAIYSSIQSQAEASFMGRTLFRGCLAISKALRRVSIRIGKLLFFPLHHKLGPKLRVLATGGAAMEPELAWNLEGLGWRIGTGYGLTETSPMVTLDKPGKARIGTVGRPVEGSQIRIDPVVDEEGNAVEPDQKKSSHKEGEIVARGPGVFAGYHNLPEKTEEAFTDDGWFRTGDLGYLDRAGYLHITGRVKTLIVLEGGEKAQPDDVEQAYQKNSAIREAGVLEHEGKIVAVILPAAGTSDDAIRQALEERSKAMPSYQRIVDFVVARSPLPRTRLGKIRREELKKLYEQLKAGGKEPTQAGPMAEGEMSPEDRALLEDSAARKTWELLAKRFASQRLTPDANPQLDLGVDSLEWLSLTLEIRQETGVELEEDAISRIESVRDLLREVTEHPESQRAGGAAEPLEHPEEVLGDELQHWLSPEGPVESAASRFLYALDWALVRSAFKLDVQGLENLPKDAPFVLAPNHVSFLDSFVLAAALDYRLLRDTYWAGWSGMAFGPVFRVLRRLAHVIPIDPDKAAASSLAFGAAVLRSKHDLVWFPEGTHSKTGELETLRPGIGMLLEHYPVPVVPVHLQGTRDALPPGRFVPRPGGSIRIVFGKPLDPHQLERDGEGEEPYQRITNALQDAMASLN
jgi:long-chain acyl-CoA synthetase